MSQVPTSATSITAIMKSRAFRRGVDDARSHRRPAFDLDCWEYERGRLFAALAPVEMPVMENGRLHRPAVAICRKAFSRKEII